MTDAIVIGSGPNGLVAANLLADAGWSVHVFEAEDTPGGAVRSAELVEPGFVNDVFSSFYPLAAASPAIGALELEQWGLRWRHGPLVLAHPARDGSCVVLSRSLEETCASLEEFAVGDGRAWRELYGVWERVGEALLDAMVTPFPPILASARIAAAGPMVFEPLTLSLRRLVGRRFRGEGAARLLAGNALHADLSPERPPSGFFGWFLVSLGQDVGFPFPEGGAGRLAEAMVRRLEARGGAVTCGARVERVLVRRGAAVGVRLADGAEVSARHAVLADVDAPSLFRRLVGEEQLPVRVRLGLRRFRWDPATFKLDWTLDAPVPWLSEQARLAPVVHLGPATLDEFSAWSAELASGRVPSSPFLVCGQHAVGDPTRSPAGKETVWAYTRVPRGLVWSDADADSLAEAIEGIVESHAPGFRGLIRGRHLLTPAGLEARDSNLAGGSLNGGTARLRQQLFLRPVPGAGRPETPVAGLYLASASAHPGGGVHGACGAIAARAALRAQSARRTAVAMGVAAATATLVRRR